MSPGIPPGGGLIKSRWSQKKLKNMVNEILMIPNYAIPVPDNVSGCSKVICLKCQQAKWCPFCEMARVEKEIESISQQHLPQIFSFENNKRIFRKQEWHHCIQANVRDSFFVHQVLEEDARCPGHSSLQITFTTHQEWGYIRSIDEWCISTEDTNMRLKLANRARHRIISRTPAEGLPAVIRGSMRSVIVTRGVHDHTVNIIVTHCCKCTQANANATWAKLLKLESI